MYPTDGVQATTVAADIRYRMNLRDIRIGKRHRHNVGDTRTLACGVSRKELL